VDEALIGATTEEEGTKAAADEETTGTNFDETIVTIGEATYPAKIYIFILSPAPHNSVLLPAQSMEQSVAGAGVLEGSRTLPQ
jgi:hypothetical protein